MMKAFMHVLRETLNIHEVILQLRPKFSQQRFIT
jgi:hypothetical protein